MDAFLETCPSMTIFKELELKSIAANPHAKNCKVTSGNGSLVSCLGTRFDFFLHNVDFSFSHGIYNAIN